MQITKENIKTSFVFVFPSIAIIIVQRLQQLDGCGGEQVESHRRDCSNASQCKVFQTYHHLIHISDLLSDSLLLDDIEDSSILRRGLPVAHKIFGEVMISPLSILQL